MRRTWSVVQTVLPLVLAMNAAVAAAFGRMDIGFASLFLAILVAIRLLFAKTHYVKSQFEKQQLGEGENSAIADDKCFMVTTQRGETTLKWSAVDHVDRLAAHTIVWVNTVVGIIIPDRAFDAPADADRFARFAKEKSNG